MDTINNVYMLKVYDHEGERIAEREMVNIPLVELFPEQDVIAVDWLASRKTRPSAEELNAPFIVDGKTYMVNKYWGSGVKGGVTFGVKEEFVPICKLSEDGQRFQRYLMAQGIFGGVKGALRIKVLPLGTMTEHGMVHDGFGYISKRLVDAGYNQTTKTILNYSRESYMFWQRLKWTPELEAELKPVIDSTIVDLADTSKVLFQYCPMAFEDKRQLVMNNLAMMEHPFIANAIARTSGELYARAATTVFVGTEYKVAVPTDKDLVVPGYNGKVIFYRFPIDSNGSIQTLDAVDEDKDGRIAKLECVQYTLASLGLMAKGLAGIVDMDDCDMIVCSEDIKMADDLKQARDAGMLNSDFVVTFNAYYGAGSCVGVNVDKYKDLMGLDVDGDAIAIIKADQYPQLYKAAQSIPAGKSPKLTKSKSPISEHDKRTEMIVKSMMSLVGMASNLTTTTFMVDDREYLARQLGFVNRAAMDERLNYFIKVGTDGFKTLINQEDVRSSMAAIQSKLQSMFGVSAPWTNWPNSEGAFRSFIPQELDENMSDVEKREAIKDFMTGTIAKICRLTLPHLKNILSEPIKTRPLSEYRDYVPMVNQYHYAAAAELYDWFMARSRLTNWSVGKDIEQFKMSFSKKVTKWLEDNDMTPLEGCYALWKLSHNKRDGTGAPVFFAFPELCKEIVLHKPGIRGTATILTGIKYQLPGNPDYLEFDGEIVEVEVRKGDKVLVRKCVVANVPGQTQAAMPYPRNMIGMIAADANQPQLGSYWFVCKRSSPGAHVAEITPIE